MKYIAIRSDAIPDIISDRALQSPDFDQGKNFAALIRGTGSSFIANVGTTTTESGLILYGNNSSERKYVVFDVPQTGIHGDHTDYDILQYVQRTLRFSIKYWSKSVRAPNEKIISARTAVVFPFALSQRNGTRIAIDLNPDIDRLSKRDQSGRYLLVYKISKDAGDGAGEISNPTVLRKFIDELPVGLSTVSSTTKAEHSQAQRINFLDVELEKSEKTVDIHQSYSTWLKLVTTSQNKVIFGSLDYPVRIEGPAGTGKTLTLILRALNAISRAKLQGSGFQAIFFTHSESTRKSILTAVSAMGGDEFISDQSQKHRLRIETLQSYCAELLHSEIDSTEFVDMDAYDAKQMQLLYIESAIDDANAELSTYEKFMSERFLKYWREEAPEVRCFLVQHEVALVIKGRASEKLDTYKKIDRVKNGLPVESEGDKAFLWRIFESYRKQLVTGAQFDTDDVAISAISQLSAPIWRRRRFRDGFDAIFIDETHLFNMNELSVFHHLSKADTSSPISYAVDKSQAIGDRGWGDDIDVSSLLPSISSGGGESISVKGIFRCAPDIVNLAFAITSSGASLFSNFENPMELSYSQMGFEEEKRSRPPMYLAFDTDNAMIEAAFRILEDSRLELSGGKSNAAIITLSDELLHAIVVAADASDRGFEVIKSRGDAEVVRRAFQAGKFVISLADYVGGLEFDEVVLVGIDAGRVPPADAGMKAESKAYLDFAAHNRLYVAVTRARYRVTILGVRERGPSPVLASALASGALSVSM